MTRCPLLLLDYKKAILASEVTVRSIATKLSPKGIIPKLSSSNKKLLNAPVRKHVSKFVAKIALVVRIFTMPTTLLMMSPVEIGCECTKPGQGKSTDRKPEFSSKGENSKEIELFREYLRIPTVHPDPDYAPCIEFLLRQAQELDLPVKIYYPANEKNPLLVMTWVGTDPSLPAILLNSHMDVVPAVEKNWTFPPFGAEMDKQGRIYARGAQDMKSVGMQYIGAIRALKKSGLQFRRTIHVAFVPDEEHGGRYGFRAFATSNDFRALKVGFSLDEGIASPTDEYPIFYGERSVWHIHFKINGTGGHGSLLLENTPGEKLRYVLHKMMCMRSKEAKRLASDRSLTIGDVTTINLTRLIGGVQTNIVPNQMYISFDVRLPIDVDQNAFADKVEKWCTKAGGDIQLVYEHRRPHVKPTSIDDSNPYWTQFKSATDELGLKIKPVICPGAPDSRFIRELGIPAIGFSPMNNTPVLLHDNDEFIRVDTYLRGIEIYKKIISKLANTPS